MALFPIRKPDILHVDYFVILIISLIPYGYCDMVSKAECSSVPDHKNLNIVTCSKMLAPLVKGV